MIGLIATGSAIICVSFLNLLMERRVMDRGDRFMMRVFIGLIGFGVVLVLVGLLLPETARSIVAEASVVKGHDCLAMQRADTSSPWTCTQMEPER